MSAPKGDLHWNSTKGLVRLRRRKEKVCQSVVHGHMSDLHTGLGVLLVHLVIGEFFNGNFQEARHS